MNISWDAEGYRRNFSFVPAYGEAVVDLVGARSGARCLDLGCGGGTLTAELAERGLDVVGMDASPEMLDVARREHPDLCFIEGDATCFELAKPVDVVFSNSVLHWIDRADQSRAFVRRPRARARRGFCLRDGGSRLRRAGSRGACPCVRASGAWLRGTVLLSHGGGVRAARRGGGHARDLRDAL